MREYLYVDGSALALRRNEKGRYVVTETKVGWYGTLEGRRIISFKNHKKLAMVNGRLIPVEGDTHRKFKKAVLPLLERQKPATPIDYPFSLSITFWMKGREDSDLDNMTTTILDLLQHAGVIADDKLLQRMNDVEKIPGNDDWSTIIRIFPYGAGESR